jgi:predicted RNA-binding protein with TRAM domain
MAYGEGGSRGRGGYGGGGGSFGGGRSFAPVKVGEEIDVKIEAVGEKGDGIAKVKGFVLFVPGVKEGQECRIKITRVLKKVGFADKVGDALGPVVSESSGKSEETASEYSGADVVEAEAEESPKDSEDFGDESGDAEEDTSEQFADDEEQA